MCEEREEGVQDVSFVKKDRSTIRDKTLDLLTFEGDSVMREEENFIGSGSITVSHP